MLIFPAIDIYEGKAVRLYKGDYRQITVYSEHPEDIAEKFREAGAECLHLVDLEGALCGSTPNLAVVSSILKKVNLYTEIGGGIRSMETIERYLDIGINRVILGTAAVKDRDFLEKAASRFVNQLAVGVDIKEGEVAVHGWTEKSGLDAMNFCGDLQKMGIKNIICTDISKDGAMQGTNLSLYKKMSEKFQLDITASGGVTNLNDIRSLAQMKLYGAIIGKAYYTGAIRIEDAIEAAKYDQ